MTETIEPMMAREAVVALCLIALPITARSSLRHRRAARRGVAIRTVGIASSVAALAALIAMVIGRDGITSLTAGFVVSYMVMGLGWIPVAIALLRTKMIGVSGWLLILASLIAISPAPFRCHRRVGSRACDGRRRPRRLRRRALSRG